jgi:acyl-coenzyme A synthetase/AMP-(fatty) acid ligase/acyl carrier protein
MRGAPLPQRPDLPATLLAGIRGRLDLLPAARLWTLDDAGRPLPTAYRDLWPRAIRIAGGLADAGVGRGETVALLAGSVPDFVAVFWACLMGGHKLLPLSGRARRARETGRLDLLRAVIGEVPGARALADAEGGELARALAGEGALDLGNIERRGADARLVAAPTAHPVCWLPTSGATGRDKLAGLGEAALLARRFRRRDAGRSPGDVRMWVYDPDSVTGLNAAFVHAADWVQLSPAQALSRPELVLDLAERLQVRRLALTCSLARVVAEAAEIAPETRDLAALVKVAMGGEAVDAAVARRLADALGRHGAARLRIFAGYGATETGSLVVGGEIPRHASAVAAPVDLGRPAAGVDLRIVDEEGNPSPRGEIGAIEARCPELMFSGYADAEGAAAGFRPDGWWRTGDLGRLDDGRLSLHGRAKQVIALRGRKLALEDFDGALAPAVGAARRAVACRLGGAGEERLGVMVFGPADAGVEHAVRRALGEAFGVQPERIGFAAMAALPLGSAGKLLRSRVAELLEAAAAPAVATRGVIGSVDARLGALWRECLPNAEAISLDSHFFADGGDSLAALRLFAGVEAQFGSKLRAAAFFADPTLRRLTELVAEQPARKAAPAAMKWPLPPHMHGKLSAALATWPGERPTPDRLMVALNGAGRRPPLFWVFQSAQEFAALAAQMGEDQPVYGFRSGHGVYPYDEDSLQQIALRYVQDVLAISPDGPLFVGGNCQGGRVALAMAEHLLRRGVHLPLLILMEWGFELTSYGGDVLFLHGHDSLEGHPWLRHAEPERAWRRRLRRVETEIIPGRHGRYFLPAHAPGLAEVLTRRMAEASARPPVMLPRAARLAEIRVQAPPERMAAGQKQILHVTVRNASLVAWPGELSLGNYWLDKSGRTLRWRDGRATTPALKPGETADLILEVTAPATAGVYDLAIDMVEEGGRWFDRRRRRSPVAPIVVI